MPFGFCTGSGAGTGPTTLNAAGDAVEMLVNKVAPRGDPIELLASGCTDLSSVTVEVDLIGLSALQGYRGGAACEDGVDNDGDGLFDWPADPECASGADADEAS